MLKIDDDIPPLVEARGWKAAEIRQTIRALEIGQSFFVAARTRQCVGTKASAEKRATSTSKEPKDFTVRAETNRDGVAGFRVWRIEPRGSK